MTFSSTALLKVRTVPMDGYYRTERVLWQTLDGSHYVTSSNPDVGCACFPSDADGGITNLVDLSEVGPGDHDGAVRAAGFRPLVLV